jgi:hypothetical protein
MSIPATSPPSPTVTPSTAPLSFREKLESVFFGEQGNGSGMQVTSWRGANFPKEPTKVVHHLEEASMVITFTETTEQEIQALLDQITLNGVKGTWMRNERSPKQFRLSHTQVEPGIMETVCWCLWMRRPLRSRSQRQ